jgi:ribosome maturation factor RimP
MFLRNFSSNEKNVTVDDLREVHNSKGTKSILEGLEKYINNNYCLEE